MSLKDTHPFAVSLMRARVIGNNRAKVWRRYVVLVLTLNQYIKKLEGRA